MHYRLAIALAESAIEATAVVLRKVVSYKRLTTKLVYTLKHLTMSVGAMLDPYSKMYLVCRCVSETGEQRKESARG